MNYQIKSQYSASKFFYRISLNSFINYYYKYFIKKHVEIERYPNIRTHYK